MPEAQKPVTIVYDRMWSINSATNFATTHCETLSAEVCQENARRQEKEFYRMFSTSFQSEAACSGLALFALDAPEGNSASALLNLNPAVKDQWKLNVGFRPGQEKREWSMTPMMKVSITSGEGDAHSMAHTVCLIAKGTGGQVVE